MDSRKKSTFLFYKSTKWYDFGTDTWVQNLLLPVNLLSKFTLSCVWLLLGCYLLQGQTCIGSLGDPVVNITFGTGTGFVRLPTAAPAASTTYSFSGVQCPNDGSYSVTSVINTNCFKSSWYNAPEDHTPNDVNGRMAVFNASFTAGEFYKQTVSGLCSNTTYEFGAWVANILKTTACGGSAQSIKPNLLFTIESLSGTVLGTIATGNIGESASLTWKQYALTFTTPASTTQVVLKISNNAIGGCGNDLVLDDITFCPCGPAISVLASAPSICEGSPVSLSASILSGYISPQFQWQKSMDDGQNWSDIAGATSLNTNVTPSVAGTLFRLLAAEQGNIGIGYCRIASSPLAISVLSTPILTVLPTSQPICTTDSVQALRAFVNIGIAADWYDAPTGGNKLATGVLSFKPPKANATYYIEAYDELTNCKSRTRAKSSVAVNEKPSFVPVVTGGTCNGTTVEADAKIRILEVKHGKRYDISTGKTYQGGKDFDSAQPLPIDGVILDSLTNPDSIAFYAVRVFDSTGCFTDSLITFQKRTCQCPPQALIVIPESQIVCQGDTFRTVRGYVDPGITVDWYDAQGNLLKAGSVFFKPTASGVYYAEARVEATGCKSLVRTASSASTSPKPAFVLKATTPTCIGNNASNNIKLIISKLKAGSRFDFSEDSIYVGNKNYDTATPIPLDSVLVSDIANPARLQTYTVRVFGQERCFTDQTFSINRFACGCLPFNAQIITNSFALCATDSIPRLSTILSDNSLTVDWYNAATGGQLLAANTPTYQPAQLGTYYAEARVKATGCASSNRAAAIVRLLTKPIFELDFRIASCRGDSALQDGSLRIKALSDGDRFDYSTGMAYTGAATYQSSKEIPANWLIVNNLPNPNPTQPYTVRVFNRCGAFGDRTIIFTKNNCTCSPPNCFSLNVKRKTKNK